ncbi:MAG: hypothetical protein GXO73_11565 [Calditrichaeota bacterium]|nr:hypothetical protein [Calditrichota bacterium]
MAISHETQLRAGYGEADITPPLGTELGGYGFYLNRRAERVLSPLKVRAVALHDGQRGAVLVSVDLLGFTVEASDRLRQRIASACRLPVENVLVACTHTHSSPPTQPMPGLGDIDPAYVARVEKEVVNAAQAAWNDLQPARFTFVQQAVEPIGYNRARGSFSEIDPTLSALTFSRENDRIHLLNYACHPVTLGPTREISADFPGALAEEIQARSGGKAVFFQGFCGNIDPVVNLNHWAGGTFEDVRLYGRLLAERVLRPTKPVLHVLNPTLAVSEDRIALPLVVGAKEDIPRAKERFVRDNAHFPGADRFAEEWQKMAFEAYERYARDPFVRNVPIQALRLGPVKLVALPGEVFTNYGMKLRRRFSPLVPLGYANGNVGYIPTARAYRKRTDYAAHAAPKFYALFPFPPKVEQVILDAASRVLAAVDRRGS